MWHNWLVANIVFLPLIAALMVAGGVVLFVVAWLFGTLGDALAGWLGSLG